MLPCFSTVLVFPDYHGQVPTSLIPACNEWSIRRSWEMASTAIDASFAEKPVIVHRSFTLEQWMLKSRFDTSYIYTILMTKVTSCLWCSCLIGIQFLKPPVKKSYKSLDQTRKSPLFSVIPTVWPLLFWPLWNHWNKWGKKHLKNFPCHRFCPQETSLPNAVIQRCNRSFRGDVTVKGVGYLLHDWRRKEVLFVYYNIRIWYIYMYIYL